jgi:hypothetical protein
MKNMCKEAFAEHQKSVTLTKGGNFQLASLAYSFAKCQKRSEARKLLEQLKERAKQEYVDPSFIASAHAALGEKDTAFAYLEKAYQSKSLEITFLKVDPAYDEEFRSDPRFNDLLRRIGLPLN